MPKHLAILGSTGSIGTQTLDVVRQYPDLFIVEAISGHSSVDTLIRQAHEFHPQMVCVSDSQYSQTLKTALPNTHIVVGNEGLCEMVSLPQVDMVVSAVVGFTGLLPTLTAIKHHKTIALANKETLVVAGELITRLCAENNVPLLPIDSEHSAIYQCLQGEDKQKVSKLLLTASGGPFRTYEKDRLTHVTAHEALQHPTWSMGSKITIDSATMLNKGFEIIEARWLFDIPPEQIEVLVHPQSIVHSAVQYIDGSVKAQLGVPDMHLPIQYALTYPDRLPCQEKTLDLADIGTLTFEPPDMVRFPWLQLAYEALHKGGTMPCVLNASNEVVNKAFREGRCGFYQMSEIITSTMAHIPWISQPTLEDYLQVDQLSREYSQQFL